MTAAHYKGGHHPGNGLGLHYTALPPIVASCPYSDQLLATRKFWSPGANRPSQVREGSLHQARRTSTKINVTEPWQKRSVVGGLTFGRADWNGPRGRRSTASPKFLERKKA